MKFGQIKLKDDVIFVDKDKPLNFFVLEPFRQQRINFYYLKLAYTLEEGTNRLVFKNFNNECIPYNKEALINYLNISRQYFDLIFRKLCHRGIIMQVKVYNIKEFYMNPRFVCCGNQTTNTLLNMFRYDSDGIYGEHIFDIKNTIYERGNSSGDEGNL